MPEPLFLIDICLLSSIDLILPLKDINIKIISNFHDYYDGVQKEGQDRSLLYLRKPSKIVFDRKAYHKYGGLEDDYPFARLQGWKRSGNHLISRDYTIGFCGKLYPVVKLSKEVYKDHCWLASNIRFCWSLSAICDYVVEHYPNKEVNLFMDDRYERVWTGLSIHTFKSFFKWFDSNSNKFESIFIDNKAPILVGGYDGYNRSINFNCPLKDYEFYKIKDPYTAFQDISMWISNQANPFKPIPQVSDKDLAIAKGFDKWSFRKEPSR